MAIFRWVSPGHAVPVVPSDPPMSAERIARLPSELRTIVLARCGAGAEAGHYFATYDDNSNVVRLDYSLLQCPNAPEHCESSNCVHTFVRRGGKYLPSHSSGDHSPRQHWRRDLTLQFPSRMHANDAKDRLRSQDNYEVNLMAEPEILHPHGKLDHLMCPQRLIETQNFSSTCPSIRLATDVDIERSNGKQSAPQAAAAPV